MSIELQKYNEQKSRANGRKIEWQFTFESWIQWWGDDFINRGLGNDQLVMCRKGDLGPYHPDNCYKASQSQNAKDASLTKKFKLGRIVTVEKRKIPVQTPNGKFNSILEAANYYSVHPSTILKRIKNHSTEYYRLEKV
jgi:hypothetical protein